MLIPLDGNNILEVHSTISKLAKEIKKNPKPILLVCMTFRMRGHEEASGVKYVPKELMDSWAEKDPVKNYEEFLLAEGIIDEEYVKSYKADLKAEIEEGLKHANSEENVAADKDREFDDIYAPHDFVEESPTSDSKKNIRMVDAISEGLRQSMERHDNSVIMGQDIAEYGGVFKITEGFVDQFGKDRVRNTPICESSIISAALGLSICGYKSIVEMQFGDFVTSGFNPSLIIWLRCIIAGAKMLMWWYVCLVALVLEQALFIPKPTRLGLPIPRVKSGLSCFS